MAKKKETKAQEVKIFNLSVVAVPQKQTEGKVGVIMVHGEGETVYMTPVHISQTDNDKLTFINYYQTLIKYLQQAEPNQFIPSQVIKAFNEEICKGTAYENYHEKVTFILI